MLHSVEVDLGNGRIVSIESGKMAKQANGAVVVRSGESVVLADAHAEGGAVGDEILRAGAQGASRAVLVGGSFIACEVALALASIWCA